MTEPSRKVAGGLPSGGARRSRSGFQNYLVEQSLAITRRKSGEKGRVLESLGATVAIVVHRFENTDRDRTLRWPPVSQFELGYKEYLVER